MNSVDPAQDEVDRIRKALHQLLNLSAQWVARYLKENQAQDEPEAPLRDDNPDRNPDEPN
jgi:hypothetical protein